MRTNLWQRIAVLGVATAAAVLIVVLGAGTGSPAQTPRLLSGSAWLPSPKVGQVTLLDGSSTEIAAQLQVASAGNNIDVVQQGSTAYAVDRTAGTVRRIDGATYAMSSPEAPFSGSGNGLTVFTAPGALYAVDTSRGLLSVLDPKSLARRGESSPLATELTPESTMVDGQSRLWFVDNATGVLTRLDGTQRTDTQVASPGRNVLTMAGGQPVVVDTKTRKATVVDADSADVDSTFDLGLRPDDTVTVTGSPGSQRLYLVAGRGVLIVCDTGRHDCGDVVPLDRNSSLGAPVEAGDRVFVPDYGAGQVWIIDLKNRSVLAKPQVLSPRTQFQLINRDGVVFYNDTGSERAGVIELDGRFTPIAKFDPKEPGKGLNVSGPGTPLPSGPATPGPTDPAVPTPPTGPTVPTVPPGPSVPVDPRVTPTPSQPAGPTVPTPPTSPTTTPPTSTSQQPPPTPDPLALKVTVSKMAPQVGEDVTLQVSSNKGEAPRSAAWDFGDGAKGNAAMVTHKWAAARTFQVSVQVTMPDGRTATTSVGITVSEIPKAKLTVTAPVNGKVNGPGIACPPTCTTTVNKGQSLTLTAQPAAGFTFGGWGGACSGTATCKVTMDADKTVSARFTASGTTPFAGSWVNVNSGTGDIIRAKVTVVSPTTATLNLFGSCSPTPCDWGNTTATLVGGQLQAFYDQDFATRTVRITQSGGQLTIRIHHDYVPPDTRADRDSTDVMRKN